MSCFYTYNGENFRSELDLVNEYIKNNFQLQEGSIYSAEEVQQSTIDKIKKITDNKKYDEDINKSNDLANNPDYKRKYTPILDIIRQEQSGILGQIEETKNQTRLAPEYDEDNRIHNYIIKNLEKIENVPQDFIQKLESVNKGRVKNDLYSSWRYEKIKGEDDIRALSEGVENVEIKVKYLLHSVESEIELEKLTGKLSRSLYEFIRLAFDGKSFEDEFDNFYHSSENKDIIGESRTKEEWYSKILQIVNEIKSKIENIGEPITDLTLVGDGPYNSFSGKINLLAVDVSGNAHIFAIKASKNSFGDWDSAKLLDSDWELALQKQLLGQHINIENTQLYIVPIAITSLKNPNRISLEEFKNRSASSNNINRISSIADKLLPRKFYPKHDNVKIEAIKEKFNKLIPNYEIRTDVEDESFETIMSRSQRRFDQKGIYQHYNSFEGIEGLKRGWIESKDKSEFEELIRRYVAHVKSIQNKNVSTFKNAIISAIRTNQSFKTTASKAERDKIANRLLQQYLNEDWEVLESIPESVNLGIILFRNKKTGVIDVFNLSVNQFKSTHKETGMTVGDLETMKVMLFLNEFRNHLFPNSAYKLGEIVTFNTEEGTNWYDPSLSVYNKFKNLMSQSGLSSEIIIDEKNILGTEDVALLNVKNAFKNYVGKEEANLEGIFSLFEDRHLADIERDHLIKVRNLFLEKYPEYKNMTVKPELNFNDSLEVIFSLLQVAILSKEGIEPTGDFRDLSKYSIGFSDFKSLIAAIYTKDVEEYDKTGKKIQGIVGGLAWTTPEWVRSKDLRQITGLISSGNSVIGERMVKFNEVMWKLTDDFYNDIGYSRINQLTWGETQTIHEDFFLRDSVGEVSREFKTKNPYVIDEANALNDTQRNYLKKTLLLINGFKLGISEKELNRLDPMDIDSLRSNKDVADALDDGSYFEMPLVRREELSRYKGMFMHAGDSFRRLGAIKDNITDWIDSRELSQYDISNADAQKMGFFEMYDVYGTQSRAIKDKMINENTVHYYEFNLDTIAHRLAFSKIRKQTFDMILPTVSAYMWWIKLMGGRQDLDVSKQLEYIVNQVKLAVFDEPLIGDEQATIAKGIAFARQVSTVAMLAFRPALLAKELTIGTLKNISASATGLYEEFGTKEMTQAYTKLITIDKQFTNEFNMIQKLNHMYRIANMDISTVPKKIQHDRHGAARGLGRWMFTTSTAADYYNRLAILLAKMIKDGSYDAHSMEGNKIVYDPTKDKRFSHYLAERENHKNADGEYMSKKGDKLYNDQRNMYLLTIQQLNKENAVLGGQKLTESDLITKAYTQRERDSIKAMSDLMYGAYDKDSQAQFPNTLMGITFMQFMTYWPNKMKFWFGKPVDAEDSVIGKYEHAYRLDENNNKVMLYWDYVENPDGTIEKKEVDYETDEKMISWTGTPQEGLFYSVAYTLQDLVRGNWDEVKSNKLRKNRTLFALGDAVFILILLGIMREIFRNLMKDNGRDSVSGELLYFMDTVNTKVLNEYDVWDNTLGAINTEPLALSWGVRTAGNIKDVLEGDKALSRALGQSVGAFEWLK